MPNRGAFDDLHQIHKVVTGKYGGNHAGDNVKERFEEIDSFHCVLVFEDDMDQAALNVRPVAAGQCSADEIHEENWNHLNLFQAEKHIEIEQSQRNLQNRQKHKSKLSHSGNSKRNIPDYLRKSIQKILQFFHASFTPLREWIYPGYIEKSRDISIHKLYM